MKVNISFLPDQQIGFVNHSILALQGNIELNEIDDNELEELLVLEVIEYLPRNLFENVMKHWVSKLAHKGRFTFDFVDIYTVSRLFFLQLISINDYNILTHGQANRGWDNKQVNLTTPQVCQAMENLGLKVISKKIDGVKATIVAERP